jgi:hypothetical protein
MSKNNKLMVLYESLEEAAEDLLNNRDNYLDGKVRGELRFCLDEIDRNLGRKKEKRNE